MTRYRTANSARRGGNVIPLLAVSMTFVLAAAAIALDGGLLMEHRRQVQSAADLAAMAAATDLYANYISNSGVDQSGTAAARAREAAAAQGFKDGVGDVTVTVNIPPTTGNHVGEAGYAEVTVRYLQPRYFSSLIGTQKLPVTGRAVARGMWSTLKAGILVLDPSVSEALKANGGGTVSVDNSDIIVNSSNSSAVGGNGTGAVIRVTNGDMNLSGGIKPNTTVQGNVNYKQRPTPDPLAYLPAPPLPSASQKADSINSNSAGAAHYLKALGLQAKDVNKMYVLEPGRYDRLPNFTNGDLVILKQASASSSNGVYYLNGSGFTSTGATVVMDPTGGTTGGLMFYVNSTGSNDGVSISGGKVQIDPPSSGVYAGISLFQRRASSTTVQITGQGGMQFYGTFYVAGGELKITGSNSSSADVIGSQYISGTLQSGGNGQYKVDWSPQKTARVRKLGLVE